MSTPRGWPLPRAAYVHVPFCARRCGYCNFAVVAGRDDLVDAYLEALARELSWLGTPCPVATVFIGGGTPTHLRPDQLDRLLRLVLRWFPLDADGEFTVEANPADVNCERLAILARHGVTRISLGAQSLNDAKLRVLERDHSADDVVHAVELARHHFAAISLDLIFAAPGESFETWASDLEAALALGADHLSTYGLTYERGTRFFGRLRKKELHEVEEELQRCMYEHAIRTLTAAGFEHYEISNFARRGRRCRHNEVYWAGDGYYAAGAGAARYIDGRRETNHRSPFTYIQRALSGASPVAESESLGPEDRAREMLVLGLRRIEGVEPADFTDRSGMDIWDLAGEPLRKWFSSGLAEEVDGRIRLTREGLLISDSLWPSVL